MPDKKQVVVSAGVIEYQGKILIGQRKKTKSLGGFWEFPGGKIETGETPEQTLIREIKEEFDIQIQVGENLAKIFHDYPDFHLTMFVYRATWNGQGKIKICDHEQYKWVDLDDLQNFDFPPADKPVLEILKNEK